MRTPAILALVVLVLGALVIFDFSTGDPEQRAEQATRVLEEWAEDDEVVSLAIIRDEGRIEIVSEDGVWRLVAPIADHADGGRVTTLISALRNLRAERRFAVEIDELAELGLEEPSIELELETRSGAVFELGIGREMPLDRLWSLRHGSEVAFARGFFIADLERELEHWRDRNLLGPGFGDPIGLAIDRDDGVLALERRGQAWWLEEPISDLASPRAAADLVGVLQGATITGFDLDEPEITGSVRLSSKTATLELSLGASATDELEIHHPERGWLRVRLPRPLLQPVEALRCPYLWCFEAWEAEALSVGERRLQRGGEAGVWELIAGASAERIDTGAVYERWQALSRLRASPIDGPWTLDDEPVVLELEGVESVEIVTVAPGIVAISDRPGFYEVDTERFAALVDLSTF